MSQSPILVHDIKQGATMPVLYVQLVDDGTEAWTVTGTVLFQMKAIDPTTGVVTGNYKVNANGRIVDANARILAYDWQTGDTDTIGHYYGEFEVNGGKWPTNGYILIRVGADV